MLKVKYPNITMYSRSMCSDCVRSKAFLDKNKIPYKEINILEDTQAQKIVINLNDGEARVPTIIIDNQDNKIILSEPSDLELSMAISKFIDS
jgi:glutaredoxin|tara:strand:- start:1255 stop:1530 length:276 start_codon:yes stop_codon:yes gene_type:complete